MNLHSEIKDLVTQYGPDIICQKRLVGFLDDRGVFGDIEMRAYKGIVRDLVGKEYARELLDQGCYSSLDVQHLAYRYSQTTKIPAEEASFVLKCMAYGLGWIVNEPSVDKPEQPKVPKTKEGELGDSIDSKEEAHDDMYYRTQEQSRYHELSQQGNPLQPMEGAHDDMHYRTKEQSRHHELSQQGHSFPKWLYLLFAAAFVIIAALVFWLVQGSRQETSPQKPTLKVSNIKVDENAVHDGIRHMDVSFRLSLAGYEDTGLEAVALFFIDDTPMRSIVDKYSFEEQSATRITVDTHLQKQLISMRIPLADMEYCFKKEHIKVQVRICGYDKNSGKVTLYESKPKRCKRPDDYVEFAARALRGWGKVHTNGKVNGKKSLLFTTDFIIKSKRFSLKSGGEDMCFELRIFDESGPLLSNGEELYKDTIVTIPYENKITYSTIWLSLPNRDIASAMKAEKVDSIEAFIGVYNKNGHCVGISKIYNFSVNDLAQ